METRQERQEALIELVIGCPVPAVVAGLGLWVGDEPTWRAAFTSDLDATLGLRTSQQPALTVLVADLSAISAVLRMTRVSSGLLLAVPSRPSPLLEAMLLHAGASGVVPLESTRQELMGAIRASIAGRSVCSREAENMLRSWTEVFGGLTARQRDVVGLLACGRTVTEISRDLVLSENTVRTHIRRLCVRLEVAGQADLRERVAGLLRAPPDAAQTRVFRNARPEVPLMHYEAGLDHLRIDKRPVP